MKDKYEGYKIIKLEPEYPSDYNNGWDVVGVKNIYKCPECQYLGRVCEKCGGEK